MPEIYPIKKEKNYEKFTFISFRLLVPCVWHTLPACRLWLGSDRPGQSFSCSPEWLSSSSPEQSLSCSWEREWLSSSRQGQSFFCSCSWERLSDFRWHHACGWILHSNSPGHYRPISTNTNLVPIHWNSTSRCHATIHFRQRSQRGLHL